MGKVKNVTFYDGVAEMLEDLRFDNLLKEKCGMLESFRPKHGGNSKGNKKEINKYCNEIDVDDLDPEYERFMTYYSDEYSMFLENFEEDGNGESFSVYIPSISGDWVTRRYEEEEEGSFQNLKRKRNFKNDSKRVKVQVLGNCLSRFSRKTKIQMPKIVKKSSGIGAERSADKLRDVPVEDRKSPVDENGLVEVVLPLKSSGEPSKKINRDIVIDESFEVLMGSLENRDKNMDIILETYNTSIHQKDDESCSDMQILALDDILFHEGDYTPFVPSKCYQSLKKAGEHGWDGVRTSTRSRFREKLMDLLKTPYDQNEFDNLWREVTYKKPVQGSKDLRHGRMISYSTKSSGKSYLDWYQELRMKIDEFRSDRRKVLYLLRGFFFWLENTAHEGAFQPWLDSLYLSGLG